MKRINLLVITVLYCFITNNINGQVMPIYNQTQYLLNPYIINPAFAGSKDYAVINFSSRQYMSNVEGAPRTQIFSFHNRIGNVGYMDRNLGYRVHDYESNVGYGGMIFNDIDGPFRKMGFEGTYAYHIPFDNERRNVLSFGASAKGMFYSITPKSFNQITDPLLSDGGRVSFVPDVSAGTFFNSKHVYTGFSANNIFQFNINWKNIELQNTNMERMFFFMLGGRIPVKSFLLIEPMVLLNTNSEDVFAVDEQFDASIKVYYYNFYVATSYKNNNGMAFWGMYQFDNLYLGLGYEFPFSNIRSYNYGVSEIVLGFNFGRDKNKFRDKRYW